MGHQDQSRKNYRSTQVAKPPEKPPTDDFTASPMITDGTKTNHTYASVIDIPASTGQIYTDQNGRFPVQSSEGHNYIMVLYDYDSNAILEPHLSATAQPKNCSAHTNNYTKNLFPKASDRAFNASTMKPPRSSNSSSMTSK